MEVKDLLFRTYSFTSGEEKSTAGASKNVMSNRRLEQGKLDLEDTTVSIVQWQHSIMIVFLNGYGTVTA